MMTQRRNGLLWLAAWATLSPSLVLGRDFNEATNLYSEGVHAYFAGRVSNADMLLSRALELNDRDPRFYYFRALSRLRLGRDAEARRDMAAGAAREANRANRFAVGAALQRVQGSHRLLLEQYRRDARSRATGVGAAIARQQSEQMNARDAGAYRERIIIPLDELFRSGDPRALSSEEVARRAAAARQSRIAPAERAQSALSAPSAADNDDDPFQDDASQLEADPSTPLSPESSSPPDSSSPLETSSPPESSPIEEDTDENPFDF